MNEEEQTTNKELSTKNDIKNIIQKSIDLKRQLLEDELFTKAIHIASNIVTNTFKSGRKVFFCGNGGSAADAQHLSTELSGRFYLDRKPLFAEALHVNTSFLTAVANDFGYEEIYARMVEAKGSEGDVLVAISTSGNSPNIIRALQQAKEQQLITIGMTGETGGKMAEYCDVLLNVPSIDTPRIQECHILIGHIICELVEREVFNASMR